MNCIFRTISLLVLTLSAGVTAHPAFASGQKLDVPSAIDQLRKSFSDTGLVLDMQTASLLGKTAAGETCSVQLDSLGKMPNQIDNARIEIFSGKGGVFNDSDSEVVFEIDPASTRDRGSYNITTATQGDTVSMSEVDDHLVERHGFQDEVSWVQVSWHRSVDITKDVTGKITSVRITNKDEISSANLTGSVSCLID